MPKLKEMALLHLGARYAGFSLLSPESLAVIFPVILAVTALAVRPGTLVNRAALAGLLFVTSPVRGLRRIR